MTDKELDYLAEKIVELMFKKQEEYDAKLNDEINENIYYFSTNSNQHRRSTNNRE